MESHFWKSMRLHACNCTKKDAICGDFLRIYLCKYIFSFFHFSLRLRLNFLKHCRENSPFRNLVAQIRMKGYTKFTTHSYWKHIYCLKLQFLRLKWHLFVQQNIFKFNNRSTRRRSGVFILNPEYIGHVIPVSFLMILNMQMTDGILYCLNLNLSMYFRVGSRSPLLHLRQSSL